MTTSLRPSATPFPNPKTSSCASVRLPGQQRLRACGFLADLLKVFPVRFAEVSAGMEFKLDSLSMQFACGQDVVIERMYFLEFLISIPGLGLNVRYLGAGAAPATTTSRAAESEEAR